MKYNLAFAVGVLALAGLLGVTVAEMQTADPQADQPLQPALAEAPQPAELPAPADSGELPAPGVTTPSRRDTDSTADGAASETRVTRTRRARGLYIRPDGNTVGRVSSIDRSTLRLVPVRGALVSFLQDTRIAAQGVTDEQGMFAVQGLTPWGVYSVTTSSKDFVCMFATVLRPYDHEAISGADANAVGQRAAVTPGWVNEIRFVSTAVPADEAPEDSGQPADDGQPTSQQESGETAEGNGVDDGGPEDYLDYEFHEFQLLPREDFLAALRAGLFGPDVGGVAPAGAFPGGGMGGGGGGGGSGGGGFGAGLIGAGIGAAIGAGTGETDQGSPFQPNP